MSEQKKEQKKTAAPPPKPEPVLERIKRAAQKTGGFFGGRFHG